MKNIKLSWLFVPALAFGIAACDVEQNSEDIAPEASSSVDSNQAPAADAAGIDMQGESSEVAEPGIAAEQDGETDASAQESTDAEQTDASAAADEDGQEQVQAEEEPAEQPQS